MIQPTQEEFAIRAKQYIDTYNKRYEDQPFHQLYFHSCDAKKRCLELTHPIYPEELNVFNGLHGGAMAWLVDSCAGLLCRSYLDVTVCVTVNLNINYIKSVSPEDPIVIRAAISGPGRRIVNINMDIRNRDTDQLYCTASSVFYICE